VEILPFYMFSYQLEQVSVKMHISVNDSTCIFFPIYKLKLSYNTNTLLSLIHVDVYGHLGFMTHNNNNTV